MVRKILIWAIAIVGGVIIVAATLKAISRAAGIGGDGAPEYAYEVVVVRQDSIATRLVLNRTSWGKTEHATDITIGGDFREDPARLDSLVDLQRILAKTWMEQRPK